MHDDPTADSTEDEYEEPHYVADIPCTNKAVPSWSLALYSDWLVLSPQAPFPGSPQAWAYPPPPTGDGSRVSEAPVEPPEFGFFRRNLGSAITLNHGLLTSRVLEFHTPMGKFSSVLPDETLAQVKKWIGPYTHTDLAIELRKRVAYFLLLALFLVLNSFVLPSSRAMNIGGLPIEPVTLGLAALLVLIYLLGRFHPRRFVFLLEALWWGVFFADIAYHVRPVPYGTSLSYLFIALGLWFMYGVVRAYRRFAPH